MMDENNKKVVAIVLIALLFAVMAYSNPQSISNFFNNSYYNTTSGGVSFNGSAVDGNGSSLYNFTNLAGTFNHSNLTNLNWYSSGHTGLTLNETIKTVGVGKDYTTVQACYDSIPAIINGNVTCSIDAGTYPESLQIGGKSANGNYWIKFKSASEITFLNGVADAGGSAGTSSTQPYIKDSGLVANAYNGKWIRFTSGTNSGKLRVIENNSATTILLVPPYLPGAPDAGDTFTIIDNGASITGTSSIVNPTTIETIFEKINIGDVVFNSVSLYRFNETRQNITGYDNNKRSGSVGWHRYSAIVNTAPVSGIWMFGGSVTSDHSLYWNSVTPVFEWRYLIQGGGHVLSRNGDLYKRYGNGGIWTSVGGTGHLDFSDSYAVEPTNNVFVKDNAVGLLAETGSQIYFSVAYPMVTFINNSVNYSPIGITDPKWIG